MSTPIHEIPSDPRSNVQEDPTMVQDIMQELKAQENPNAGMDPQYPDDMSGYQTSQYVDQPGQEIEYADEPTPPERYYREPRAPSQNLKSAIKNKSLYEKIWQELKTPLLVLGLYILFSLRVFDKTLMRYIPRMSNDIGHISFIGLVVKGILVALLFFLVQKFI